MIDTIKGPRETLFKQSELIIKPKSVTEEFEYLWGILGRMPFLKKQGYVVELPDDPTFRSLSENPLELEQANKSELLNYFSSNIYDQNFFNRGLSVLESQRSRIEQAFPVFYSLKQKWGFKVFPTYQISLTRYGPGGSYSTGDGMVTMMTRADGTFKRQDPGSTAIHEMVHIGIEEPIVKMFGLDHWEKERLVDRICQTAFSSVLPEYKLQGQGDSRIDAYVSSELLTSLPESIQRYIADFPRKK